MKIEKMVEEYQCPGCTLGFDTKCGSYKLTAAPFVACINHSLGSFFSGNGKVALGLPRGFNRPGGLRKHGTQEVSQMDGVAWIRLWSVDDKTNKPQWDKFNVPVWAMEQNGALFVRTLSPRIGILYTDIVDGGKLADIPKLESPIDVGAFYDGMD